MVIDVGVCVPDSESLGVFVQMAQEIGFTGFATHNLKGELDQNAERGFSILRRNDVSGRGLKSIIKQVDSVRKHSMIVAVMLTSVETANWAAENQKVDVLTIDPFREHKLRTTTARLAAMSGTALEIRFEPLLQLVGLNRSKVVKIYQESVRTATDAGMQVIISSGATKPLHMRSPVAMQHIGELLGLSSEYAKSAIRMAPLTIIERSRRRFSLEYVAEGIEIVKGETET